MYLQLSPFTGRWCVRLGLFGAIVGSAVVFRSSVLAQVVPDNTVGSAVSGISGGEQTITGGTRQGGNLFHSFQQFSVPTNGTAFFNNATDIQNILTRVTGGSRSDIDGLIRANGTANLFLLNPNGIIFGQNASLRIGGSFIATTARSISFADGTQFSATPSTGAPLLTVSVPLGLQFGTDAGGIVNRSRATDSNNFIVGLQVQPEKTLGLIGGNVNMEGGWLTARGGRIELGAVAAPGVVGINPDSSSFRFSFPTDLTLGDISLTNSALVDVRAGGSGSIAVNARNLSLSGGNQLVAGIGANLGSTTAVAGDIDINVKDAIAIDSLGINDFRSGIFNNVEAGSTGKGGNININTGSLRLSNGAVLVANTQGQGDAGSIQITATNPIDAVVFESGSFIQTDSFSQSSAGNVSITADGRVSFIGTGSEGFSSGVFSSLRIPGQQSPEVPGDRKGGNINIKARSLFLTEGARIRTSTYVPGSAGNVTIAADEDVSLNNSRIFSQVESTGTGKSGDINIKARALFLSNGAELIVSTAGAGNAGNIFVRIDESIALANSSNIFSNVEPGAVGNGGTVEIAANSLSLTGGAQIQALVRGTSDTLAGGRGNAGSVNIDIRDTFTATGASQDGLYPSGVFNYLDSGAVGKGGDINLKARSLSLENGAQLQASTFSSGDAGSINITADDRISLDNSSIFSRVERGGIGKGGNVTINARALFLSNGAQLNASTTGTGNAGNIFVRIDESLALANSSYIFSNVEPGAVGNGGTVEIAANSLSLTGGAQIQALVRGTSGTLAGGRGNAGSVNIDIRDTFTATGASQDGLYPSGVLNYLDIGAVGKGGDINLKAGSLSLENGAQVNANTFGDGDAGSINITADDRISLDNSSIFSRVERGGIGKGGNVTINARALFLSNGAQLNASTIGTGNAGNVFVRIDESLALANSSYIFSNVEPGAVGNGGTVEIAANSLSLTGGGQIQALVRGTSGTLAGGRGNAGSVNIDIRDTFTATGASQDGLYPSGVFNYLDSGAVGKGGDINLKARSLSLENGAQLQASTFGTGNAGNIVLRLDDSISLSNSSSIFSAVSPEAEGNSGIIDLKARSLSLINGGVLSVTNFGQGNAGNINVDVSDSVLFEGVGEFPEGVSASGVYSALGERGRGRGGNISLKARYLSLKDGGTISTSAIGQGNAGNIDVDVRTLDLDGGRIVAESISSNGGNIQLQASKSVRLRNGSQISTSAGGTGQPGNGGNITITSPLVIANFNGNNDITANAFFGSGGQIEINAQSIFGLESLNFQELQSLAGSSNPSVLVNFLSSLPSNDVAAISLNNPSLSGTVNFNAADIDPSRDVVELPTGLVDASALVAAGCPSGAENRFTVAGRGGLPPAPGDKLSPDTLLTDWAILASETSNSAVEPTIPEVTQTATTPVQTIQEATSWQFDRDGKVMLTTAPSVTTRGYNSPTSCQGS